MRAGINSHAQSEQLIINIWLKHNAAAMTGERVNNITVLTGTTAASHNLHMFDPFVQDVVLLDSMAEGGGGSSFS